MPRLVLLHAPPKEFVLVHGPFQPTDEPTVSDHDRAYVGVSVDCVLFAFRFDRPYAFSATGTPTQR